MINVCFFCLLWDCFFFFFPGLPTSKIGATDGQDLGATWLQHHTPFALDRKAFSSLFFPFFLTLLLPGVCVFDFAFNLVWLAVNGAWLVLGINDMTRDTPLLEFSQVRATPIDSTPLPLCLPSKLNESFSFSPSFCCSFNLSKKERWTQKSLLGGIWRWARGKEGVPDRRGEEQRSLWVCVWMREVAESEQPALAARSRSFPPALGPEGLPS